MKENITMCCDTTDGAGLTARSTDTALKWRWQSTEQKMEHNHVFLDFQFYFVVAFSVALLLTLRVGFVVVIVAVAVMFARCVCVCSTFSLSSLTNLANICMHILHTPRKWHRTFLRRHHITAYYKNGELKWKKRCRDGEEMMKLIIFIQWARWSETQIPRSDPRQFVWCEQKIIFFPHRNSRTEYDDNTAANWINKCRTLNAIDAKCKNFSSASLKWERTFFPNDEA